MPTRFGVQFKLVRFYYAQRRAGRPRSSPIAASRQVSATPMGACWFCRCVLAIPLSASTPT
ncbi:MAG: hypothetical protein LBQ66_16240 [Planctomycetaceae bacterium]|nr:hypothetical protein [Planctomycetaceae bacterium]